MWLTCLGLASGQWDWAHRGDVRAALSVGHEYVGKQISATIEWRRRDAEPEQKRVLLTAEDGTVLTGVTTPRVEQHSGTVVFTPPTAGIYYCYYLPYTQSGIGAGFQFAWDAPTSAVQRAGSSADWGGLPRLPGTAITLEARNAFEAFSPMELSASASETAAVVAAATAAPHGAGGRYLVFPEERRLPVRMQERLPYRWIGRSQASPPTFNSSVTRGEYFTLQLAVFVPAEERALTNVSLAFVGFTPPLQLSCFNRGGVGPDGEPFEAHVTVPPGQVRAVRTGAP